MDIYKESDNSTVALQRKGSGASKYETIALYDSPYGAIDKLEHNNLASDRIISELKRNAFELTLRGAQISLKGLDGARYQIKNTR